MTTLQLTSPAFANGDPIPDKYQYFTKPVS